MTTALSRLSLLCLLTFLCVELQAQAIGIRHIPLDWSDFQSSKPLGSRHAAAHISYALEYHLQGKGNQLNFNTRFKILKDKSWVDTKKLRGVNTSDREALLMHERGHLLIGLMYYNQLQKAFDALEYTGNIEGKARRTFNKMYRKMNRYNKKYDKKTAHGMDKHQQDVWIRRLMKAINKDYTLQKLRSTLQGH